MKNSNVLIPIKYPQKLIILIEFDFTQFEIHNSFDYLEEKWESIVDAIREASQYQHLMILNLETEIIYQENSLICLTIIFLANPPNFTIQFILDTLLKVEALLKFTIKTMDKYNSEKWEILYTNQI